MKYLNVDRAHHVPANKLFGDLIQIISFILMIGWVAVSPVKGYAEDTSGLGLCPQSREKTPKASEDYIQKVNPLEKSKKNLK